MPMKRRRKKMRRRGTMPKNPYAPYSRLENRRRPHGLAALWQRLCGHIARQVKRLPRPTRRTPRNRRNRRRKCGSILCPWRRRTATPALCIPLS